MNKFDDAMNIAGVEIGAGRGDTFVLRKSCNNSRNAGVSPELALAAALLNVWPAQLKRMLGESTK